MHAAELIERKRNGEELSAGDVGEFNGRRHVLARIEERGELIQPVVGHTRDADVCLRLAGGSRRVARAGHQLEERCFA